MNIDFRFYWSLLIKRLPAMALFVVVFSAAGVLFALRQPEVWSTSARLLVEAPQIPDTMVRSTVQTDAVEQLDVIEQRLLTRANLIDIANQYNVFENLRQMEPDEVVAAMRSATRIRRTAGRSQATLMTISFRANTGRIAADVVNQYVTLVLEANAASRIGRASETLSFFQQEVDDLSTELNAKSSAIAEFRATNADALPEDRGLRITRQSLLTERLSGLERSLRGAEAQRAEITRIFESTGEVQQNIQRPQSAEEQQLVAARAELELLLSRYSEENFRVKEKQNLIERLEAIVAAQAAAALPQAAEGPSSPEEALYEVTVAEVDNRIEQIQEEIERTNTQLTELQGAITRSAANGLQLADMARDYEILQTRYNAAVANLNQAQMSERIETTARGQRITVIENAAVPRVPSGPDRLQISAIGTALGLALAVGYFMLQETLNRRIRRPAELTSRFGVTPIATIPHMERTGRKILRRAITVGATLSVLIGAPAIIWYVDTNIMPVERIVESGLRQLGFR